MMCSSWKISVFGIVALMLAFGLMTTDAEAQPIANHSAATVAVSSDGDTALRASVANRIITFTVATGFVDADTDQEGIIEIQIPTGQGWSSPRRIVGTDTAALADAPAGSVTISAGTIGDDKIYVGGHKLRITMPDRTSSETITWNYKTNVPERARNSNFRIISRVQKDDGPHLQVDADGPDTSTPPVTDNPGITGNDNLIDDKAIYDARGNYIVIKVGPAPSGTGTFALTTTGIPKGADDYKVVSDPADTTNDWSHAGKYFVTAEREYNLVFTYTAPGTLYKGSVIRFTIPQDAEIAAAGEDWPLLTDGTGLGRVTVSGATLFSLERGGTSGTLDAAAAFLPSRVEKGHTVRFTYSAKTPKVTTASDTALRGATEGVSAGYVFMGHTISVETADDDVSLSNKPADASPTSPDTDAAAVGGGVTFVVVKGQGGGALSVVFDATTDPQTNHGTNISPSNADSAPLNLVLRFTADGRMLQGSQITVAVPDGWTPGPRTSRVTGSSENGIVTATSAVANFAASVAVTNRLITVTMDRGELVAGDTIDIIYSEVKQPATGGINTFAAQSSSRKGEALQALAADKIPVINVIAGDGSGSIALMEGAQRFSRTMRKAVIPTLQFVYTPAGHLPVGTKLQIVIPGGWSAPKSQNNDGTVDAGELSISPADKVTLELPAGQVITARATKVLAASDRVTITYGNVTVPDVDPRSDVFTTRVDIVPNSTDAAAVSAVDPAALVSPSPTVGIGQAPDGAGTMIVNMTQVNAGDPLGDLVFTYTAAGNMTFGAQVQLKIDPDWPAAIADDGTNQQGMTTVTGDGDPDLAIADDGYTLNATLNAAIVSGNTLVFTYRNITAPSVAGVHEFTASSQHTSVGILTVLEESPSIDVRVRAAGTVALATPDGPLPAIQPGDALGDLQFTFTAGARMEIGSQVVIVIPAGWTRASEDNGDAVTIPGEVALGDMDAATLEADINADGSYTVTVTTTGVLLAGEMLTLTYQDVTAPADEGTYSFDTSVSAVAGGSPLPIDGSPQVVVRTIPTALTLDASANTFFVNESITLTVELDARAPVGGLDVALTTDPADMGTFSMTEGGDAVTTVRVADSADSMSAMVYYTSDMPGPVTLTATSGELEGSAAVTAKSTIDNLMVNGKDMPDPVLSTSTITVTATGREGKATVAVAPMATADVPEPKDVVTPKGLDVITPTPEGTPEGDVAYTRDITLPGLKDGYYTVTVTINGEDLPIDIEVIDDQDPPTLSDASAWPDVVANGGQAALRVTVTPNESNVEIASVTADVSDLDSTRTDPINLKADDDDDDVYATVITVRAGNTNADGVKTVSFTATDRVGNVSEVATAEITLKNDVIAPVLSMASAMPAMANEGTEITISVSSEADLASVTADASAIGGGMVTLSAPMMDAANGNGMNGMANGNGGNGNGMTANGNGGNGNGMTANGNGGNGNGMTANGNGGNGNGMTANGNGGNGNGMTANGNGGNGNGMTANGNGGNGNGMDANGNVMYSGTATVTGAADGEQTITITATDGSGNSSDAMVTVTIDNTGPALTMASADPAMATNGTMITISVSTESGATVMADASAIGGDAATALAEGMDEDMMGTGMYSADVAVADDAMDGDHMISISATDALGNAGDDASVTVTVDNTAPALADPAITPDWALNGDSVTISVSTESGATVTADASAIGGAADLTLAEGMDADMMGTGMYSADVTVTDAEGGDQMVSITASDALGNMSDAASASVSIHAVTSASFSPAEVSTGDTVMVTAMGTAGLTATFSVFDAEGNNIVTDGSLTEDAETAGSYSGSFEVVIDAHPTGTYWVSVAIGQASMTAEGALKIDHAAQFTLEIAAGTHLIHVPLDVTHIDGVAGTIDTVGDLYDALGDSVNFIISLGADGTWNSYLGDTSAGGAADAAIGDDTGLIAVMSSAASLTLAGNALGSNGEAAINFSAGNNLVGVPLDPTAGLSMISDALAHPAVSAIVVSNAAGNGFNTIAQAGDPGDGAIMGGVGYIVVAAAAASITVEGMAWDNSMADDMGDGMTASNGMNGAATAPSIGFQTPVLQVQGKLIDEAGMILGDGLNVSVRNVTRGTTLGSTTAADDYSMTFVKLDTSAAKVGDVLEIRADSSNPLIGVRPVQHVVTADDVLDSRISLPDLVTYEIPAQTELLANYPNPFNPETWIPFRLAEDSNVSLSIYGASGSLVRTIDIGFTPAAVYEGRSDAIYWDGRNDFGEQVSSGIYFYHLSAGEFSGTRKMVIVK